MSNVFSSGQCVIHNDGTYGIIIGTTRNATNHKLLTRFLICGGSTRDKIGSRRTSYSSNLSLLTDLKRIKICADKSIRYNVDINVDVVTCTKNDINMDIVTYPNDALMKEIMDSIDYKKSSTTLDKKSKIEACSLKQKTAEAAKRRRAQRRDLKAGYSFKSSSVSSLDYIALSEELGKSNPVMIVKMTANKKTYFVVGVYIQLINKVRAKKAPTMPMSYSVARNLERAVFYKVNVDNLPSMIEWLKAVNRASWAGNGSVKASVSFPKV